jgi:hypothetical protein
MDTNEHETITLRSTPVSSNNKTDRHDINEILLKVALNTITPTQSRQTLKDQRYCYSTFQSHQRLQ